MNRLRMDRLERLLERASALPRRDRAAFIAYEAGDDAELRGDLSTLVLASEGAESFVSELREELLGSTVPGLVGEAPWEEPTDPWLGRTVSHYRIEERIGDGGMGVVYGAEDLRLRRRVALKFVAPEISRDPAATGLFIQEARTASSIDHPNICTVHEIGEADGGRLFLVMPAYEGETLRSRLRRGRLSEEEALEVAEQMARALAAAHQRGIVHGDVKPANVFVTRDGIVKLLDFGLARVIDASVGRVDELRGTLAYMSPERLSGRPADERSDVWAVGAVMRELLGDPAAPELARVVERALAPRPDERFSSGVGLLQALQGCRPEVRLRAARKRAVGRRIAAVAGAAGVVGLASSWLTWSNRGTRAIPAAIPTVANVLWADDNPTNNTELVDYLEEHGIRVTTALSTQMALELYDPSSVDLVISDMGRYEGETGSYVERAGFELLAGLRARNGGVRLVFFTSEGAVNSYRDEAAAAGAAGIAWTSAEILSFVGL